MEHETGTPMRIVICGSRDFENYTQLSHLLDLFLKGINLEELITGGAKGTDKMVERYARERKLPINVMRADWEKHGKSAGPIRNTAMAQRGHATLAFWNGQSPGTLDMINKAKMHVHCYIHVFNTHDLE